jgi:hypothetical protein
MLQDNFTVFCELSVSVRLVNPRIALDKFYRVNNGCPVDRFFFELKVYKYKWIRKPF